MKLLTGDDRRRGACYPKGSLPLLGNMLLPDKRPAARLNAEGTAHNNKPELSDPDKKALMCLFKAF